MKNKAVLLIGIAAIAALMLGYALQQRQGGRLPPDTAEVTLYPATGKALALEAEVADAPDERANGLMHRQRLDERKGMLFTYPESAVVRFWMKNTLIPLDMIFIAENMTVVKIHYAVPCKEEPCKTYSSEQPVKYVLEVNGNLTYSYNIKEGNKVMIK